MAVRRITLGKNNRSVYGGIRILRILGLVAVLIVSVSRINAEEKGPLSFSVAVLDSVNRNDSLRLNGAILPAKRPIIGLVVSDNKTVGGVAPAGINRVQGVISRLDSNSNVAIPFNSTHGSISLSLLPGQYSLKGSVELTNGTRGTLSESVFLVKKVSRGNSSSRGEKISMVDKSGKVVIPDLTKSFREFLTQQEQKGSSKDLRLQIKSEGLGKKGKKSYLVSMINASGVLTRQRLSANGSSLKFEVGSLLPGFYLLKISATGSNGQVMPFAVLVFIPRFIAVPTTPLPTVSIPVTKTPVPSATPTPKKTTTVIPTPTPIATRTATVPTPTPLPTLTPTRIPIVPTPTSVPTNTPVPTATVTPRPTSTPNISGSFSQQLDSLACQPTSLSSRLEWGIQPMTVFQIKNVIEQIFGASVMGDTQVQALVAALGEDRRIKAFDTETRTLSRPRLETFLSLVSLLSSNATSNQTLRVALESFAGVNCNGTLDLSSGCGASFLTAFLDAAQRRLVPPAVRTAAQNRYVTNRSTYGDQKAYASFISGALSSAHAFLHLENAERGKTGVLSAQNLAARTAFTLTGAFPDVALREAANSGALVNISNLSAQARRLMRLPFGRRALAHFAEQWQNVALIKAPPPRAGYLTSASEVEALKNAAKTEIGRLFEHTALDLTGGLEEYYSTARVVPSHSWLSTAYGVSVNSNPVTLTSNDRRGLFNRVAYSLHGVHTQYMPLPHRGYGIFVTALCGSVGAFPNGIDIPVLPPATRSSREYYRDLTSAPFCAGCHAPLNPIGNLLSNLSVTGLRITQETVPNAQGQPVEVPVNTADSVMIDGRSVALTNAMTFSDAVGASNDGKACFSVKFVDHALGKKTSATCAARRPYMVLKNKTGGLEEAMVAFITAPEFMGQ